MKYAIMIKIDCLNDDWIFVTTGSNASDLKPLLFDDPIVAEDLVEEWRLSGKEKSVKVVPYLNEYGEY